MAVLKTYKVIALSVGGRGKRIFNSGDTVTENDFLPGLSEQLVQRGYLVPVDKKVEGPVNEYLSEEREPEYTRNNEDESEQETVKEKKPKGKRKN